MGEKIVFDIVYAFEFIHSKTNSLNLPDDDSVKPVYVQFNKVLADFIKEDFVLTTRLSI